MNIILFFYIQKKVLTETRDIIEKEMCCHIITVSIPPEKMANPVASNTAGNACYAADQGKFEGIIPASKGKRN